MRAPEAARAHWQHLESYHAVVYFAPEVIEALVGLGLPGFWMGYFAGRAAPLGPVGPAVAEALFYNFNPELVRGALPAAWDRASPELVLGSRLHAVDAALWTILAQEVRATELVVAAQLARKAAEAADCSGRALAAAHAEGEWPTVAHLVMWQAATVLREHRGDGHVITLVNEGVSGLQAHLLAVANGQSSAAQLQTARHWSPSAWAEAAEGLRARGVLDGQGGLTKRGRSLKQRIESQTDRLAAAPYDVLSEEENARLLAYGSRLAALVVAAGVVPFPNPMGLVAPAAITEVASEELVVDLADKTAAGGSVSAKRVRQGLKRTSRGSARVQTPG